MSVSSLPEWKQLLLERKRREEEEREKREKEEEDKLASMPAWKRGIIQRRRMKQSFGDKEREGPLQVKEGRSPSDPASDLDSSTLVQLGSEPPLSPDITGPWLDEEAKPQSLVLLETIIPVGQNSFIRTHGGWRRGREAERAGEMGHEKGNEQEIEVGRERQKEKERGHVKGHDGESGKGRDIEIQIERYGDRSGGRERDRSGGRERDRSGGRERDRSRGRERDRSAGRETSRDTVRDRERDCPRGRKEEEREEGDSNSPNPKYSYPLVPGLRTIRADNIIIIEQDRKGSDERRGRRRESEREREVKEEEQENRDVKMDLKEFLAGGGSVTEIRASEILIIKPLAGNEDSRSGGLKGTGREGDGERGRDAKCNKDGGKDCERQLEREVAWLMMKDKERENLREKDRPRTQVASSEKEDWRYGDTDDSIHNERGVRVSELLSKFGEHTKKFREHPKPPSRSKSSECFIRPGRGREPFCLDDGDRRGEEEHAGFRGVPKRSFSFSDRVICTKENGMQDEGNHDRKVVERTCSDRRVAAKGDVVEGEWSERGGKQGCWTWLSDKVPVGKHREGCIKADRAVGGQHERRPALESNAGKEIDRWVERVTGVELDFSNKGIEELTENMYGEVGFTMASVRNTEASFARRVPIRQDGRERAVEREVEQTREESERGLDKARIKGREGVGGREAEPQVRERRESYFRRGSEVRDMKRVSEVRDMKSVSEVRDMKRVSEVRDCTISVETTQQNCVITLSIDRASPPQSVDSHYNHVSAFTECSSTLLSTVAHKGTDWHSSQGAPGHHSIQSPLSQHTEDLINKIERVGGTVNERDNHKGTQTLMQDGKGVMREDTETERGSKAYTEPGEVSKDTIHSPGAHVHSHVYPKKSVHEVTPKCPKSPKCFASVGTPPMPLEIHIPRTVFYGVGEASFQSKYAQSCEGEGGKGVERKDSWRIGKPLSHIESLREKIQQREKERLRNMEGVATTGDDGDATGGTEKAGTSRTRKASSSDWCEEGEMGNEIERERQRQEGSPPQTTSTQFDVTQEVSVSKAVSQLPVPLLFSQAVKGEKETRGISIAACEVALFSSHTTERGEDPTKHVLAELRCDRGRQRKQNTGGRGEEGEDKLLEEEYRLHYLPPSHSPAPLDSLSPSLLHPPSLAEMSRIYNLKTVGSRAAVCMSDRTVDRPIPSHTPKVQSDISAEQQEPCSPERSVGRLTQKQLWGGGGAPGNKASSSDEKSGLQTVQRQVEQLQLREQQEVQRLSHDDNAAQSSFGQNINLKDKESKAQQCPRISHNQPNKEPQQKHPRQKDQQTILNPRKSQSNLQLHSERPPQPKQAQSNQPKQVRSITINSRSVLTPSPENSLHPDQGVPTTPSASPSQSPSVSPSPSPSPTHFTIRSLSGGQQVKRGTTITITPRKPVGGAAVEAVSASSRPLANTSAQSQMPVLTEEGERGKKKYPTAEEIEVIGGYQNLDKSCLVKTSKASPKGVKVCFDETQLEQVCEYPSETSMFDSTHYPLLGQVKGREEEVEEDEEERGVLVSRSSRNVGAAVGLRVLRVDESCHR
ncbi:uncharacterized protein LOC109907659 isoform X2 [Oncorhynchus kisutch]|uniref:uncharacterized protein LOC109907659 isoform X2 n=1 Tax=Oncorhynchus kisutch TaxID=8019 RepID=UPI0012DECCA0|nr:uncharacterized protein LOC109907659 isoform X2 [Oncorhynchus kisutch]